MSSCGGEEPREALLWRGLSAAQAARALGERHGKGAGEEALSRALAAERGGDERGVWFWIGVYERLRWGHAEKK